MLTVLLVQLEAAADLLCGALHTFGRKEILFLIGAAPTGLCPRGQETENLFSSGFGEGESVFRRPWHFFEVSFYLKHSCKFGIGFGGCVYFEMKTWF